MIRLWKRDYRMLEDVKHSPHTTRQLASLYFSHCCAQPRKKAAERLQQLFEAKLVSRFPRPTLSLKGKPEFVYWDYKKPLPRSHAWINHAIQVSQLHVDFAGWVERSAFAGQFLFPRDYAVSLSCPIIPDAVMKIANEQKTLLLLAEVDLGSEPVAGREYSLADKLAKFAEYIDCGGYRQDFSWLGSFKGFRVLVALNSEKRLENLLKITQAERHDFALLGLIKDISSETFSDRIWTNSGGLKVNIFGGK